MNCLILYNPIAGAGRAADEAQRLRRTLIRAGHAAELAATRPSNGDDHGCAWLEESLREAALLIVIGGDGAVRSAVMAASRAGAAIWQLPLGTENLFARRFGMTKSHEALIAAMRSASIEQVDLAAANGHPFALMASVGFDAQVVHDLAARRRGAISHWSYVGPMLRQLRSWRPTRVDIAVDGRPMQVEDRGCVIVANCCEYGFRLNPCPAASMTDGLLDVLHLPVRSRNDLLWWIARCRLGTHLSDQRARLTRGREVAITCDPPQPFQLDGDAVADHATVPAVSRLEMKVLPRALRVLTPSGSECR